MGTGCCRQELLCSTRHAQARIRARGLGRCLRDARVSPIHLEVKEADAAALHNDDADTWRIGVGGWGRDGVITHTVSNARHEEYVRCGAADRMTPNVSANPHRAARG